MSFKSQALSGLPKFASALLLAILLVSSVQANHEDLDGDGVMDDHPVPYPTKVPETPPCQFLEAKPGQLSLCIPHLGFSAELGGTVGKTGTHEGKVITQGAEAGFYCNQHDVSTPEGIVNCTLDQDNLCVVTPTSFGMDKETYTAKFGCTSRKPTVMYADRLACPGSPFQDFVNCQGANKEECNTNYSSTCVWDPTVYFAGADDWEKILSDVEAQAGVPIDYGFCVYKPYRKAFFSKGSVNTTKATKWAKKVLGDPKNGAFTPFPLTYMRGTNINYTFHGNCSFTRDMEERNNDAWKCYKKNTLKLYSNPSMVGLTPAGLLPVDDEEAVKQCKDIGCSVREMPYEFLVDRGIAVVAGVNYTRCTPDRGRISARALNAKYDGRLAAQYATCRKPGRSSSKEACEAPIPASLLKKF